MQLSSINLIKYNNKRLETLNPGRISNDNDYPSFFRHLTQVQTLLLIINITISSLS